MKRLQLARRLATTYALWPEAVAVAVVGSVARGDDTSDADLDLLVVLERPLPEAVEDVELEATLASGGRVLRGRGELRLLRFVGDQAVDLRLWSRSRVTTDLAAVLDHADRDPARHATCRMVREAVLLDDAVLIARWQRRLASVPRPTAQALVLAGLDLVARPVLRAALERGDHLRFRELLLELCLSLTGAWAGLAGDLHPGRLGGLAALTRRWEHVPERGAERLEALFEGAPFGALGRAEELVDETCALVEDRFPELDVAEARQRWREGPRPFRAPRRPDLWPAVH